MSKDKESDKRKRQKKATERSPKVHMGSQPPALRYQSRRMQSNSQSMTHDTEAKDRRSRACWELGIRAPNPLATATPPLSVFLSPQPRQRAALDWLLGAACFDLPDAWVFDAFFDWPHLTFCTYASSCLFCPNLTAIVTTLSPNHKPNLIMTHTIPPNHLA